MVLGESLVGRGVLGQGISTSAFRRRINAQSDPVARELASLENSRLADLASPSTGQERLLEQTPRYETGQAAADIYGYQEGSARGPVTTLFDFLGRGSSAVVGGVTGLFGMEREGEEVTGGYGATEALRRIGEGLSGGQQYRFSDFTETGKRIARGEEVGTLARGWNTALGFVVDTVADPLTYVSFGGSIMGRMRAANAIRGANQKALKAAIEGPNFNPISFMEDALKKNVTRTDKLVLDMKDVAKRKGLGDLDLSTTSSYDDILNKVTDIYNDTNVDLFRELAPIYSPDVAAMSYAQRSAAGLRRWAVENFGEEAGEAYFKSLPKDIQGGIRIRLPFARRADGTPIAIGIEGIGAGRLGDKYASIRKLEDLTQKGRDIAREKFEGTLGRFGGSSGSIYYEAVIAGTGRKVRNKLGTASWVDYQGSRMMDESRKSLRAIFDERFLREHEVTSQLHAKATTKYGEQYVNKFREFMYNTDALDAVRYSRNFASDAEQAAFNAANSWRTMLDEIGKEAVKVFNDDPDLAFKFLTDYVPRITAKREEAQRFFTSKGVRKPGSKPQYVQRRGQWAQEWGFDEKGSVKVLRWMPNEDIARLAKGEAKDVYETDPTVFMSAYLADVRSSLNDQKILNMLRQQNLLTKAERETLEKIDEAQLQGRVVQLYGPEDPQEALRSKRFNLRKFQKEIERPELNYQAGSGFVVGDAMASYMKRFGVDVLTIDDVNAYEVLEGVHRNVIDGSGIQRTGDGRYVIISPEDNVIFSNEYLTPSGVEIIPGREGRGVRREYDTFDAAKAAWDEVQSRIGYDGGIPARDDFYYNNYLLAKREEVMEQVAELFNPDNQMFAQVHHRSIAAMSDEDKGDYISAYMNILKMFGLDEGQAVITESGAPAIARGFATTPVATVEEVPTQAFRDWISNSGYMNIGGITFDADGNLDAVSQVAVKQKIAERLADEYAPAKLMENIQRMYKVTQSPQTVGQEIYNNFYKPLYAAQKAWMTLGRGPGFVARNVLGGSWNNWINGVGREHTLKSYRMIAAKTFAKREIAKQLKGQDILSFEPVELANMYRDANKKYLARYYSGEELDEVLEMWDLFSRNGLGGNRDTARLYGELLRGNAGGNVMGGEGGVPRVRIGQLDDDIQVLRDEDITKLERYLEIAAGDNYWLREIMSPAVEISEDYLRFAAFLKGVQDVGLEDASSGIRGYAASQWVKASQFDYADLSDFEQAVKMIVPFYSWTRNNVPLQLRTIIQQPGRIAQALRIHESLGNAFGDETEVSPSYIADRFGITFAEDNPFFDMLPEWMKPQGDVTMGIAWGDPIADVNTLFRDPTYATSGTLGDFIKGGIVNWREVFSQLNPIIAASSSAQQAFVETGPRNEEDAPTWARLFAREDPTEPGTYKAHRPTLDFIRSMVPVVDQAERIIPFFGGERQEGRWTTSIASNLFGLNLSTVDDWQKASEMQRRTDFIQRQMKNEFGPSWQYRNEMISRLLREGAPTSFIRSLNLREMDDNEVDTNRAVYTWRFLRRIELLIENGVPEDEIIASISAFVPEGSKMESLVQAIWDYVPKPSTDFETGVRAFGLQPVTRNDLEELGLTVRDVRNMTEEQQRQLVYIVNRNKGWTGPQS